MSNRGVNLQRQRKQRGRMFMANRSIGIPRPQQFPPTVIVSKVFRYTSAQAVTDFGITPTNLLDSWLFAATATTGFQVAEAVKVRKIEIWAGPTSSLLTPVTVSVDWRGPTAGTYGSAARVSDSSIGATQPAHLVASPPSQSQVAQWQPNSSNNLFDITVPSSAVIDLHLSFVVRDDGSTTAVTNALVAATTGANYLRSFDGLATAAANFTPVEYAVR
jgi:hypothetical protein